MNLLIQLIAGAFGGNIAGAVLKKYSLGPIWNSIVGILGGGLGGQILAMLGVGVSSGGGLEIGSLLSSIASGVVGGGILMVIVGLVRRMIHNEPLAG